MISHMPNIPMAALLLLPAADATTAAAQPKIIRAGRMWDGTRMLSDVQVVLDGDRVGRITDGRESAPHNAEVIDLRNYTLLPGLIDLHTHMTYYWDRQPGTRPLAQRRRPAVTVFLAQDNARRTLETGVTTSATSAPPTTPISPCAM
jgi:imidazolonepropionase-like amidohydrolase